MKDKKRTIYHAIYIKLFYYVTVSYLAVSTYDLSIIIIMRQNLTK